MLTIQEAADTLGVSPKTLYAAALDGRLLVHSTGIGYLVPSSEVDRLRGRRTLGSRRAAQALCRISSLSAGDR